MEKPRSNRRKEFLYKNNYYNQKWFNLMETDENHPNGKKLSLKGKDLNPLDPDIFKIDLLLTKLEMSPDYQSCLHYKLDCLPSNIGNLIHLRELKLDTNELKHLPSEMEKLVNLERLSLSNNLLKTLPDSMCKLEKLKSLHLSRNQIEIIPNCIFGMHNLVYLDFTSNRLKKLDKNLVKLKQTLRFVSIYDNKISVLESWISELDNLEQLWFGLNNISIIPLEMTRVEKLDWANDYYSIILDGNPIEKPPINVCRKGFTAIQKWWFNEIDRLRQDDNF